MFRIFSDGSSLPKRFGSDARKKQTMCGAFAALYKLCVLCYRTCPFTMNRDWFEIILETRLDKIPSGPRWSPPFTSELYLTFNSNGFVWRKDFVSNHFRSSLSSACVAREFHRMFNANICQKCARECLFFTLSAVPFSRKLSILFLPACSPLLIWSRPQLDYI